MPRLGVPRQIVPMMRQRREYSLTDWVVLAVIGIPILVYQARSTSGVTLEADLANDSTIEVFGQRLHVIDVWHPWEIPTWSPELWQKLADECKASDEAYATGAGAERILKNVMLVVFVVGHGNVCVQIGDEYRIGNRFLAHTTIKPLEADKVSKDTGAYLQSLAIEHHAGAGHYVLVALGALLSLLAGAACSFWYGR
jgi:hypothetical protein